MRKKSTGFQTINLTRAVSRVDLESSSYRLARLDYSTDHDTVAYIITVCAAPVMYGVMVSNRLESRR